MKIVIVGATGQLAKSIKNVVRSEAGGMSSLFSFLSRKDLLVTDREAVERYFVENHADVIINCTAYNKVDLAEEQFNDALDVNANAVKYLAMAAEKCAADFFHISTDFVFDGEGTSCYKESDQTKPLSAYAKTKLRGEELAFEYCSRTKLIRTSWLYSPFGNNFVKTIISLAKDRKQINVINDQKGTPTNAENLARVILKMVFSKNKHYGELYHYSDAGDCSWFEFAKEIIALKKIDCEVIAIPSKDYPQKAKRPKYSVMDKSKIIADYDISIIDWKDSLKDFLFHNL